VAILKTRQDKKMHSVRNADTFAPFYIKPKHVHLTVKKKGGRLGYYAAISCNFLHVCIGW